MSGWLSAQPPRPAPLACAPACPRGFHHAVWAPRHRPELGALS